MAKYARRKLSRRTDKTLSPGTHLAWLDRQRAEGCASSATHRPAVGIYSQPPIPAASFPLPSPSQSSFQSVSIRLRSIRIYHSPSLSSPVCRPLWFNWRTVALDSSTRPHSLSSLGDARTNRHRPEAFVISEGRRLLFPFNHTRKRHTFCPCKGDDDVRMRKWKDE